MDRESARPGKRPLRALSAAEKLAAIQRVRDGQSKASVARDIGVPESTLRGWCKAASKIEGAVRNSSTPESQADSPVFSSGANPVIGTACTSNVSSEDEAIGASSSKKIKIDRMNSGCLHNDTQRSTIDYTALMISALSSGVRTDSPSMLLQQLSFLANAHLGSTTQAVDPVTNSHSNKRASTSSADISAIAPTTQSCSRKSLSPTAEAPSVPVPATPGKTGERHNGSVCIQQQPLHTRSTKNDALQTWSASQRHVFAPHEATPFPYSLTGIYQAWLWQCYQQYMLPTVVPTPTTQHQQQPLTDQVRKSSSEVKPALDHALHDNDNENERRSLNIIDGPTNSGSSSSTVEMEAPDISTESSAEIIVEAIEHGEVFLNSLNNCNFPSITGQQVTQFKYLLDSVKSSMHELPSSKQSPK